MPDRDTNLEPNMPTDADDQHLELAGNVSAAVAKQILDNIEDVRFLRPWRFRTAVIMGIVAGIFYVVLLCVIGMFVSNDGIIQCAEKSPHVAIVILLVLAVVPTLITLQIAKAVFGYKKAEPEPYTPLQALLHLMKEMKG